MENLVVTLTNQNKEIVDELDHHIKTNEIVRQELDRKHRVDIMMDGLNRDFQASKHQLEMASP